MKKRRMERVLLVLALVGVAASVRGAINSTGSTDPLPVSAGSAVAPGQGTDDDRWTAVARDGLLVVRGGSGRTGVEVSGTVRLDRGCWTLDDRVVVWPDRARWADRSHTSVVLDGSTITDGTALDPVSVALVARPRSAGPRTTDDLPAGSPCAWSGDESTELVGLADASDPDVVRARTAG